MARILKGSIALALLGFSGLALAEEPDSLRFVTEPFYPYTYAERGLPAGPMVDVLRAVCGKLRRNCHVEVLPWRRAFAMAKQGDVDGIFTVNDVPEHRKHFYVSAPVIDYRYALFSRMGQGIAFHGDRHELSGRDIGVYGPSGTSIALHAFVAGEPKVKIVIEPDNLTVLRKLVAGRYGEQGLVMMNEAVATHLIAQHALHQIQLAGVVVRMAYSFGLSRARVTVDTAERFNAALGGLCKTGRVTELLRPYGMQASAC